MGKSMEIFVMALFAAFGALARLLNQRGNGKDSYRGMITGCFVASFTGVIVYFVAEQFNVSQSLTYAICGISGWVGPQALDAVASNLMKNIGVNARRQEMGCEDLDAED